MLETALVFPSELESAAIIPGISSNPLIDAILKADTRAKLDACSEIPNTKKQGIISTEQGILATEQGILPAKTKIIAG
jgi:hypothetical protein